MSTPRGCCGEERCRCDSRSAVSYVPPPQSKNVRPTTPAQTEEPTPEQVRRLEDVARAAGWMQYPSPAVAEALAALKDSGWRG